ncbi:hypothetical protein GCM10023067_53760 [Aminobacter aganoensis]
MDQKMVVRRRHIDISALENRSIYRRPGVQWAGAIKDAREMAHGANMKDYEDGCRKIGRQVAHDLFQRFDPARGRTNGDKTVIVPRGFQARCSIGHNLSGRSN